MVLEETPTVGAEMVMRKTETAWGKPGGSAPGNGLYLARTTWTVVQTILLTLRNLWSTSYSTVLKSEMEILIH